MPTAFVLSGGGSLAAVQVGMLQALDERGIHPDLLVGTSAGAINAAYVAGHGLGPGALADLAALWVGMRRRSLFPLRPMRGLLAALGVRDSLCSPDSLARLLADHLPFSHLEAASVPVHVVATDALTGREVLISEGDATSALLASCAIPGIYPSVRREGRVLYDGALADNSAISQAAALGADRIYVLPSGTACALDRPPGHPLAAAMHALTLLLEQRAILETRAYADTVDLRVMPPLCPLSVPAVDFSQAAALVNRARLSTGRWLDSGSDELPYADRFLSLHGHRRTAASPSSAAAANAQPACP
ncbi:MAG: patatin-like phospholipase family protein [Actinomycetes bacterium]